jgi:hypothetical protein
MRASRGMGCINPAKVPGAKKKAVGGAVGPLDKLAKEEAANKKLGK